MILKHQLNGSLNFDFSEQFTKSNRTYILQISLWNWKGTTSKKDKCSGLVFACVNYLL